MPAAQQDPFWDVWVIFECHSAGQQAGVYQQRILLWHKSPAGLAIHPLQLHTLTLSMCKSSCYYNVYSVLVRSVRLLSIQTIEYAHILRATDDASVAAVAHLLERASAAFVGVAAPAFHFAQLILQVGKSEHVLQAAMLLVQLRQRHPLLLRRHAQPVAQIHVSLPRKWPTHAA